MNNPIDAYIRQSLKNWAARQRPPSDMRSRLLLEASADAARKEQLESFELKDESLASPEAVLNSALRSERGILHPKWVFLYMNFSPLNLSAY